VSGCPERVHPPAVSWHGTGGAAVDDAGTAPAALGRTGIPGVVGYACHQGSLGDYDYPRGVIGHGRSGRREGYAGTGLRFRQSMMYLRHQDCELLLDGIFPFKADDGKR
jgi:hypothetical protein